MFLFKSKSFDPDQFESELKKVTTKISSNEKKLRKLKTQKRHYQKLLIWYLTSGYIGYFSYVYYRNFKLKEPKTIFILIITPILMGLIYYTFLTVYDYLINNKESAIEYLKNEHNEKLTILKEKTNFDKTKDLLARFSNGEDLKEMEKQASEIQKKKMEYMKMIQDGEKGKVLEDLQKQQNSNNGFYEHFLNALMGENELSPDKRYALICSKCLTHNGLAPPGKISNEVKYICPKCGFLNGEDKENIQEVVKKEEKINNKEKSIANEKKSEK